MNGQAEQGEGVTMVVDWQASEGVVMVRDDETGDGQHCEQSVANDKHGHLVVVFKAQGVDSDHDENQTRTPKVLPNWNGS